MRAQRLRAQRLRGGVVVFVRRQVSDQLAIHVGVLILRRLLKKLVVRARGGGRLDVNESGRHDVREARSPLRGSA
ncbi:MAG: hypothetical protein ABJA82_08280 [Myxococcales bacterium]